MVQNWPASVKFDNAVISDFAELRELVTAIRNLKAENKISPNDFPDCYIESKILDGDYLSLAAKLSRVNLLDKKILVEPIAINSSQVWINLKKETSAKEKQEIANYVKLLEQKLADDKFLQNAPAKIIEDTKKKLAEARKKI